MDEERSNDTQQRRGNFRRRISYAIAVILTGAIAGVVYHQNHVLPSRISRYVNEHYLRGTNFEFSVDGVSGFFIRNLTLTNPTLRYHSASASYNVFRADEISIDYDLMPIFAFRLIVTDLKLRNVAIHLRQDTDGNLVLPVLPAGEKGKLDVSPVINVRRFGIDGLQMKFGGNKETLAVRNVHLAGSFEYEKHSGHLIVADGSAYLIDSGKTVSEIRLDASGNGSSLKMTDFALKLDKSFVVARGGFQNGRLRDVNLIVNPISLEELHQLGLIPDKQGTFSGRVNVDGPVDSLQVSGEMSGTGLGVELSGVQFQGVLTPRRLALQKMKGAVFGSQVDGAFSVDIQSEDFVYDGHVQDLDLGRGFITDTPLPPMSLTGHVRVRRTKHIDRFDWQGELTRGVYDGFECFDVRAHGVTTKADGTTFDHASLRRPGFRAEGSGSVSASNMADVLFKVDATDLTYFWKHYKLPVVGGATTLNGRLHGLIDDFTVNLNGPFQNLKFDPTEIDSGDVAAEARHIGTPHPECTVAVDGRHGAISGVWFENPVVQLEIDTSRVQIRNARFARGDTSFVVDMDVKPKGQNAHIEVRNITVTTPNDVWTTPRPSGMEATPGELRVDSLTLVCPRGELGGSGTIRQVDKTLDFEIWGKGINLGVLHDAARLPFRVAGVGRFDMNLSGPVDDPRGRLAVEISHGVVDSVAFDQMKARAAFDGTGYTVDRLTVVAGHDSVRAHGTWKSDVSPVRIARGERPKALWAAPLSGRLEFVHYPLATVFLAAHKPRLVAAAYNGAVDVGGTLEKPTLHVLGAVVPARGPGRELPPADVDITYADGRLRVDRLATTEELNLRLTGTFPMAISFHEGATVMENEPLSFNLDVAPRGNQPVEIGRYINGVSLLRGTVSGSVAGAGTPAAPRLSGGISFAHGQLRMVGMEEDFKDIAARVDFIDDVIRLTSLSARSGDKGTLMGTGWARISNYRPADYKVDLTMREFWLRSIEDVELRTDGTLSVRLQPWRDGRMIPHITGKLDVKEANITMDITQTAEASVSSSADVPEFMRPNDRPNWVAAIDLNADKNVWIRNPDLTVEMEGDVILNRDERGLYFRGDTSILRGSYKVFGNKFQITDGTFDFSASETLRPSMTINAYTPYHDPQGGPDQNIYLSLTWPYDQKEPRIKLSYEGAPGYSDAEIWAMLGRNNLGAGVATNALERVIDSQMTSNINVQVGQRSIDDPATKGRVEQESVVGIGTYWRDIYLQYQRGLSSGSEQEVNVEYRLGRRLLLRSQLIYNSRRNSGAVNGRSTDEYNVDLKYRFEY
ncbi:MAG TPA: translocation/assembly module TamB domain-containing protein [Candidatus Krumholzibacteria bacterium]|nr:translocation/assembly module TamB domain-containing protein [Candidatus Krumholzibacteria bacterium]